MGLTIYGHLHVLAIHNEELTLDGMCCSQGEVRVLAGLRVVELPLSILSLPQQVIVSLQSREGEGLWLHEGVEPSLGVPCLEKEYVHVCLHNCTLTIHKNYNTIRRNAHPPPHPPRLINSTHLARC